MLVCLLGGVAISLRHGTDANWDLQNYHLYGPGALLKGRVGRDYLVAGMQGYFNPLADIPYYVAKFLLFPAAPRIVAALAGLPFGMLAFLTICIARRLAPGCWEPFVAAFLGLTGATTISEIGTTQNDILIADFVLAGVLLLLKAQPVRLRFAACAGLAFGIAAGLKFTAAIFLPGFLALAAVQAAGVWPRLRLCLVLLIGVGGGFLAAYGWWGYILWRHFGSPFYPLFAGIFPTPWAVELPYQGAYFFPTTPLQWMFYPFFWLQGNGYVVSELALRDPRFAMGFIAALLPLAAMIRGGPRLPDRRVLGLWSFVVCGYLAWLIGFSNLRYALPLEAVMGIFIWTLLRQVFTGLPTAIILCAALGFAVLFTRPINWGRIGYDRQLIEGTVPKAAPQGIVFLMGAPLGFVVNQLETPGDNVIRLDEYAVVPQEIAFIEARIAAGATPQFLTNLPLDPKDEQRIDKAVSRFGLQYRADDCAPIHSPVPRVDARFMRLCSLERLQ